MKKLVIVLFVLVIAFACSSDPKQEKAGVVPVIHMDDEEEATDKVDIPVTITNNLPNPAVKVLQKRINAQTFSVDMKLIEESGLYDSAVCASFKENYLKSKDFTYNAWTMTYKEALDATREGAAKARRIQNLK